MTKIGPLIVLVIWVWLGRASAEASLWPSVDLTSGVGFFSIDENFVPSPIRTAAQSVFKIRVQAYAPGSSLKFDVHRDKGAAAIAHLKDLHSRGLLDDLDLIMEKLQVRACLMSSVKLQKICPVTLARSQGTAFLTNDGSLIWTSAHILESFLEMEESVLNEKRSEQLQIGSRIRVFLFDNQGRLVFDPYKNSAKIELSPPADYGDNADYMAIRLDRRIGKALLPGKVALDEDTYILGYPHCTGCDISDLVIPANQATEFKLVLGDRSPAPNSDGHGLKVSRGVHLKDLDVLQFFNLERQDLFNGRLKNLFFTNADSTEDSSGSPILNSKGELLALVAGGKSSRSQAKLQQVTRGIVAFFY